MSRVFFREKEKRSLFRECFVKFICSDKEDIDYIKLFDCVIEIYLKELSEGQIKFIIRDVLSEYFESERQIYGFISKTDCQSLDQVLNATNKNEYLDKSYSPDHQESSDEILINNFTFKLKDLELLVEELNKRK